MVINGKQFDINEEITVYQLLIDLNLDPDTVVVEVNLQIIDKEKYKSKVLNNEDRVEIVRFVGGG
ncbi:sulfur carrier protein [Alkalithermobacter thermoalcaliphilus JW-YL-7 = DSM 7308]|uniref:Sulfur carrier protein n=1 Tax=Alkalithermobacter thermoalcaliphilus JW-YL-7 = DSM 7308 TaxID=1121328 RepID=A0A150FP62_CLOPD|nr:thiamine biosynthesis protein ThiS [[Clostridium] paradoxum JW-YL-7 = DSM 7308]SHK55846.1 sulfur carrier protein [[Clostridium] paradoxum JW-YL-7 = DSM 7308]